MQTLGLRFKNSNETVELHFQLLYDYMFDKLCKITERAQLTPQPANYF